MKLIVGLGNPGNKYDHTRHNVGFDAIDELLKKHDLSMTDAKFRADYTIWHHHGEKVVLVKPYTYMNLSGEAVFPLMTYYGIDPDDIVVIFDDMDLEPGRIRLRESGSSGGHNGIKSLIDMLGDTHFKRVKIGVGRPQFGRKVVDHVLTKFDQDDRISVDLSIEKALQALEEWVEGKSFHDVMSVYNSKK